MTNELLGEFIGTIILVLLGDGIVASNVLSKTKGENAGWLSITIGWGFAVTIGAVISGNLSPAHLNPAVTFAFAMTGGLPWSSVAPYIVAQLLGALVGAVLVWLTYRDHFEATADQGAILGTFSTGPAIRNTVSNVITEVIATFVLVFGILTLGGYDIAAGLGPVIVGILVISIGLSLGGPTGYAINPARDLGPRIAHAILPITGKGDSDWGYAWIPVVGPMLGALLASVVYGMVF